MGEKSRAKQPVKRYYRKRVELFRLIEKIKLWPSRKVLLHGIKTIEVIGDQARITTPIQMVFFEKDECLLPANSRFQSARIFMISK